MLNDNKKPVILLAFANSHEGQRGFLRGLAKEQSEIEEALEAASQVCDLQVRSNATLEDIVDSFLKHRDRVAILHYAGQANSYQLLLETDAGALEAANAAGISQFLAQRRGLKLVFLNGCSTQSQVDDLHRAGVPAVIATTRPVDDTQALNFAQTFYKALSTGSSVRSGRRAWSATLNKAKQSILKAYAARLFSRCD